MAANFIKYDRTKDIARNMDRGLSMLIESRQLLTNTLAAMVQMIDNGGATAADFDQLATEGGYSAGDFAGVNEAAQASYNELASLLAKLNTDGSVSNVDAAIKQIAAKHGVV
jgi:hypothetical protein